MSLQSQFLQYAKHFDTENKQREEAIILSKQITSDAKKLIFAIHRNPSFETDSNSEELSPVNNQVDNLEKNIHRTLNKKTQNDSCSTEMKLVRWPMNFYAGIEEYVEAYLFKEILKGFQQNDDINYALPSLDAINNDMSKLGLHVTSEIYIMGLLDATGELMRLAMVYPDRYSRDVHEIVQVIQLQLTSLSPYIKQLQRYKPFFSKLAVLNDSLQKLDTLVYELALKSDLRSATFD